MASALRQNALRGSVGAWAGALRLLSDIWLSAVPKIRVVSKTLLIHGNILARGIEPQGPLTETREADTLVRTDFGNRHGEFLRTNRALSC